MNVADKNPITGLERDRTLRIVAWSTGILALLALIASAKIASTFVAPTILAGLFALTLAPVVTALERFRIPATISAALVVSLCVIGTVGGAMLLAPSADDWRIRAPSVIRSIERQLRKIKEEITESVDKVTAGGSVKLGGDASPADAVIESGRNLAADAMLAAPEILLQFIYVAFLCFFMLAERSALRRLALSTVPSWKLRLRLSRAMLEMRQSISIYLLKISIINALLGVTAAILFWFMELPNAALWGVLVGLLNFMPYIGPMIANLIVFAVGMTAFNDAGQALYAVLGLAALNIIEGQIVTPMTVGRGSQVSALAVFVALAFGAWLWGALGALVSTPLLIIGTSLWRRMVTKQVPVRSG